MRTQSSDTNPKVEELLIEMIRKKNVSERISKALSLSSLTIKLSKRAIMRANPGKNRTELDLLFVEYHYGKIISEKLRIFIAKGK